MPLSSHYVRTALARHQASEVARELVLVSDAGPSSAGGGGELGLGLEVNDEWTEVHSGRRRGGVTRTG